MSANNSGANQAIPTPQAVADRYREVYEQLLKLADKAGAAYAEAFQQSRDACAESYRKLTIDVGSMQAKLADQGLPDWQSVLSSATSPSDPFAAAKERTLATSGDLAELSRTIGLAYLDAGEKTALAAVKAYEELGASSSVEAVKAVATTHANLARQFTQTGAGALRQFVA